MEQLYRLLAGFPAAPQGRAVEVLADYEQALAALRGQRVLLCALGLHQDARGGVRSSVLTLTARPLAGAEPGAVLADLRARAQADRAADRTAADRTAADRTAADRTRTAGPDAARPACCAGAGAGPGAAAGAAPAGVERHRGAGLRGPDRVALLQLCAAPAPGQQPDQRQQDGRQQDQQAGEYREVLLAVAHTLAFPAGPPQRPGTPAGRPRSRIVDALG
ncbi:hypothetical protein GXW82_40245 [Streptacidiphilus sp. 4-A2]|nr:hypothetical protein [Streptacidiphilus sp. 4-A2]